MVLFCSVTERKFQKHGSAAEKLLSARHVRVLCIADVNESADRNDISHQLTVITRHGRTLEADHVMLCRH